MSQEPKCEQPLDERLDEALEMTFPAIDPIAVHSSDPCPTCPPQPHEETPHAEFTGGLIVTGIRSVRRLHFPT